MTEIEKRLLKTVETLLKVLVSMMVLALPLIGWLVFQLRTSPAELKVDVAELQQSGMAMNRVHTESVKESTLAVVEIDSHGVVVAWSSGAMSLTGFQASEVIGYGLEFLMPDQRAREAHMEGFQKAMDGPVAVGRHRVTSVDCIVKHKDGRTIPVNVRSLLSPGVGALATLRERAPSARTPLARK